ncbi:hypothetical protein VP01_82g3 [Puccinia sorghi]|uniref:Glycosyl transferase CAP10 domain-containing protein n=1 Tax=Puccinia sorghi TaxID=27349 RepID=A0A0L6U9U5_9BASI|nr:hypothetical protein VP01_82g3 [Puccinia sorghi]
MTRYHLIAHPRPHTILSCLIFLSVLGLLFFLPLIKFRASNCKLAFGRPAAPPIFFNTENGLLVFASPIRNHTQTIKHPIEMLITNAQLEWERLLERQSTTLAMAVQEYKKRNHQRLPPKGFEKWWQFAVDNHVGLVDEYDQISKDLEPFWAIEPARLRRLVHQLRTKENGRRLIFDVDSEGKVNRTGAFGDSDRATALSNLMESYQKYSRKATKPFTMVIGADDQAEIKTTWRERSRLLELAQQDKLIDEEEDTQLSETHSPYDDCPPGSAPRSLRKGYSSFVFDHPRAMDICLNLEQVPMHGSLLNRHNNIFQPITPLFSFSKTHHDSDIRVTPLEQYNATYGDIYAWNDPRRIGKAFWRGSTTGLWSSKRQGKRVKTKTAFSNDNPNWKNSHRLRLHRLTRAKKQPKQLIDGTLLDLATVNPAWFDVEFVGEPIQCEPPVCEELKQMIDFREFVDHDIANLYKYALDDFLPVDGNGWSGRFHKLLSSNRVVIKNTIFPEWYADRIQLNPGIIISPLKRIIRSYLHDIVHFLITHDDLARKIAKNGRNYSQKYWRKQDMAAYMFRLSLEWSRLYNREICDSSRNHRCESYDFELGSFYSLKLIVSFALFEGPTAYYPHQHPPILGEEETSQARE